MFVIVVHGGAGHHSSDPVYEKTIKRVLRSACLTALSTVTSSSDGDGSSQTTETLRPTEAVEKAICVLEDNEHLNAGFGSNLTIDGGAECDASIMDGRTGAFGSVGSVEGVKNPITLAYSILRNSQIPHPLGRIPPLTLSGKGAASFARSHGIDVVPSHELVSERARQEWQKWKSRLEEAKTPGLGMDFGDRVQSESGVMQDTVGAVCCNDVGEMASGVSSGGILLKHPGRIGEAAVYGAGCWAHSPEGSTMGVACSVSGTGEQIVRSALARTICEAIGNDSEGDIHGKLQQILDAFVGSCRDRQEDGANAGVILLVSEHAGADRSGDKCRVDFGARLLLQVWQSRTDRMWEINHAWGAKMVPIYYVHTSALVSGGIGIGKTEPIGVV